MLSSQTHTSYYYNIAEWSRDRSCPDFIPSLLFPLISSLWPGPAQTHPLISLCLISCFVLSHANPFLDQRKAIHYVVAFVEWLDLKTVAFFHYYSMPKSTSRITISSTVIFVFWWDINPLVSLFNPRRVNQPSWFDHVLICSKFSISSYVALFSDLFPNPTNPFPNCISSQFLVPNQTVCLSGSITTEASSGPKSSVSYCSLWTTNLSPAVPIVRQRDNIETPRRPENLHT